MEILVMQVFVSLLLVTGSVLLFAFSIKQADHEHHDRLSLFPIEDDPPAPGTTKVEPRSTTAQQ